MKSIILFLFVVGLVMVVSGYHKQNQEIPPPKVVYKYIPKTFEEEQNNPIKVSQFFSDMFEKPTPWHNSLSDAVIRKEETQDFLEDNLIVNT